MKPITQDLAKKSGIYMLINKINGKRYIGSSKNLRARLWEHRSLLRHNKHINQHLQNAWNKYGEINFEYSIIEFCNENIRYEREQFYVDTIKPEYNISTVNVEMPDVSLESRQKLSETRKRKMATGEIPITHNNHVYVYYKDGSFVGEWISIKKAAKALHLRDTHISDVLKERFVQYKGYKFFYTKQEKVEPFEKPTNSGKVEMRKWFIVTDGVETLKFFGLEEIAKYFNTTVKTIRIYSGGKHKLRGKYTIYRENAVS